MDFILRNDDLGRVPWPAIATFTLTFWLSGSLIVDFAVMPSLYFTGMMEQSGFAVAGYTLFWLFNRVEVLCAALVLTAALATRRDHDTGLEQLPKVILAALLLIVALVYTYALAPEMSGLGLQLNLFESAPKIPTAMNQLHSVYGVLEILKFTAAGLLLKLFYRQNPLINP